VNHGGHVGHQEGDGEPRKHAQQGRGPCQFGVQESDFESNSESRTTLPFKKDLLEPRKFEIKYCFEGLDERNNFPYRNLFRFEVDFE
jgi:hypothetical protein